MSDNLDAQPGGRLLKLPSEIRLLIYEHIFPPCKVDIHAPHDRQWVDDDDDAHVKKVDIALLTTCRTIHAEATPILYANTEFYISFACSGPDLYLMKAGKHRVYPRLLQDLQGRVRSLLSLARKVSLSIVFTDNELWEDSEKDWFQQLLSELARLGEAVKLKQLHITFEADEHSLSTRHGSATIRKEFENVLSMLSEIQCRAAVTSAVHPSLGRTDIKLGTYLDTVVNLQWVDITHDLYSKRLARVMTSRVPKLHQEILEDLNNCIEDIESLGWFQVARSRDRYGMARLKEEHDDLHLEMTAVAGHLDWFSHESWAHKRAH